MILQIVKELEDKIHFLYIEKCHNSVINYGNLPINSPKRDTVGTNLMHMQNLNETCL